MDKKYTTIPLEQLTKYRSEAYEILDRFEQLTGQKYFIRTFFLGPREVQTYTRPASTPRRNATGAKIAFYELVGEQTFRDRFGRARKQKVGNLKGYF